MRTNSIISTLRRRRALRRSTSRRIKYAEALQMLKAYENGELKLDRMIDNKLNPSKSLSNQCKIEGCGQKIRYEYVLKSKVTDEQIIAGSTCVWVMLGMSDEEIKEFIKIETTIKDFNEMLIWRKSNMDVWNKLGELKAAGLEWFRPFWEEVEFCKLHPEDESYIRTVDVAVEIKASEERKARRQAMRAGKVSQPSNSTVVASGRNPFERVLNSLVGSNAPVQTKPTTQNTPVNTKKDDDGYKAILGMLATLVNKYPKNDTLVSIKSQADSGKTLTDNQLHRVKVEINKEYYETHIKGTPAEVEYNNCDKDIQELFTLAAQNKEMSIYMMDMDMLVSSKLLSMINKYRRQFHDKIIAKSDEKMKLLWKYFRIKHQIIMK